MRWLLAAVAVTVVIAAALVGARRVAPPRASAPPVTVALTTAGRRTLRAQPITLARDSLTRHAEQITLRVRNISCRFLATGSGWAIDSHTLVTNRHVLAGAAILELDAWDGTSIEGDVASAQEGRLVDIGIATIASRLPAVAKTGPAPKPGAALTAVGYPLGGRLSLSRGHLVRYLDGRTLDRSIAFDGRVMQLTARVKHGNSGGPVLDAQGRVVGVIYAGEPGPTEEDFARVAYALPLTSVRQLLRTGGTQAVLPCEQ